MQASTEAWSLRRVVLFRFAFVYLVLFFLPPPLAAVWDAVVPWVGAHVIGIEEPIANEMTGSGDRMFDWVRWYCVAVLTVIGGSVWCVSSRLGRHDARLYAGMRVGMRYVLAFAMLGYGFAKVVPMQFGEPGAWRLVQAYGDSSPMGLLWTFMGHAPAYQVFTGLAEVLGGTLLLARRTTTLGALVVVGVMTNVVMLNFCYDVPVKINSTHWLLLAILLVLPDARRLADVLVFHRSTTPAPLRRPFTTPRRRRVWLVAKSIVVALMFAVPVIESVAGWRDYRSADVQPELLEIQSLAKDGVAVPLLVTDPHCWRRLILVQQVGFVVVQMNGERLKYRVQRDGTTLTLMNADGEPVGTLVETIVDGEHFEYRGTLDGATIEVTARRVHREDFLLASRGFHWVSEAPFNR